MADVTGQIGQEQVVLNNAATEATLKQLLGYMQIVAAKSAKEFKSGEDLNKAVTDLKKKTQDAVKAGKKFETSQNRAFQRQNKNTDAVDKSTAIHLTGKQKVEKFAGAMTKAANGIVSLANKIGGAAGAVANMNGSVTSAVGALGQLPLGVGELINGVFGPVAAAIDKTHESFMTVSSIGANFGGNMKTMMNASAAAGMTIDQFSGTIKKNAESLMYLGGSTEEGAKRLAKFAKDVRGTPVAADLARLGYSTTDISDGFANYTKMLAKNGRLQGQTDAQLREGTAQYMKNLDAVSKLTGKTKESLQAEADARQADAQYRIMMSKLGPKQQAEMEKLMNSIPKAHQAGLKEIMATGTATSDAGIQAMAYLQNSSGAAQEIFKKISSGQGLEEGFASQFYDTYAAEAKKFAASPIGETLGKFDASMNDFFIAAKDVGERQKTLGQIIKEQEEALKKLKMTPPNPDDFIDPAKIQEFKQNISQKATEMMTALASIDTKKMEEIFNKVADLMIEYLPKAINFAAENFDKLAAATALMNIAAIAATAALSALAAVSTVKSMLGGGGGGGGGGAGPAKGGKGFFGKWGSRAGNASKLVGRIGAPLAIAGAMYEGYQGVSEAEEQRKAGNITENQATVAKSEAIGSAAGGAGGALAGAAAGAAIGSVVPIVGTAIGGLIGGAIGYWAGSKGGEAAGEAIGEAIAGPDTIAELEKQIADEQARIQSSQSGVNEYWGSEESGRKESLKKIQEARAELDKIKAIQEKKAAAEGKPVTATAAAAGAPAATGQQKATDAQTTLNKQADEKKTAEEQKKKAEEDKKKTEEEAKQKEQKQDKTSQTKKTSEEHMAMLNTQMEELVRLTEFNNRLMLRQIGATNGLSSDAFVV